MVYRDYWALSQWYAHYRREIGGENLFIVTHGRDDAVQGLCPEASVFSVPRDCLDGFDRVRGQMLNSFQNMLGQAYDWVIRTDADELICLDPGRFASFADLFGGQDVPALFALGLNVVELNGEARLMDGEQALDRRANAVFTGHYSKAFAVRNDTALMRHGVKVRRKVVDGFPFRMPAGVYLLHLKYAHRADLSGATKRRQAAGRNSSRGGPGKAWRNAQDEAAAYLEQVQGFPQRAWPEAEAKAYARLQTPVRTKSDGLVRARSLRFKCRTVLPPWFKQRYGSDQ